MLTRAFMVNSRYINHQKDPKGAGSGLSERTLFFLDLFLGLPREGVAQWVKRLPTTRETRVRSLGREDPLEKEMAIHSSTLAWKIPWTEEPGRLQSMGSQRVRHD